MLRAGHVKGAPIVLPNAWDAASARAIVAAGFAAVATTSGGVAAALGYDDHEGAPAEEMLDAAARIIRAVEVPVTVDFEAGYGLSPEDLVAALKEIGAAGANLEDTDHQTGSLRAPAEQAERLAAVRRAAVSLGYPIVINARVDVFILERGRPQLELVDAAIERAIAYLAAGADCAYPILLNELEARRAVVSGTPGPTNVTTWPGGAPVPELAADGVARISYGTSLFRSTTQHLAEVLKGMQTG